MRSEAPRGRPLATLWGSVLLLILHGPALAHSPVFVIADTSGEEPRLAIAPGSLPIVEGVTQMNFAPAGPYAGKFITDLPGYDATLFPFGNHPGVQLRIERVAFDDGITIFGAIGSTTPILTADGQRVAFLGHTHFVHAAEEPGVYRIHLRYVDAAGILRPTPVFTLTFRAAKSGDDSDEDGSPDTVDNCVSEPNADQADVDGDGVGDACDCCPDVANRNQRDLDRDGVCDACRCDGDAAVPGDLDCDTDVDQSDFGGLQTCLSGMNGGWTSLRCLHVDFDDDVDVDEHDFSAFEACAGGPGVPADANCLSPD